MKTKILNLTLALFGLFMFAGLASAQSSDLAILEGAAISFDKEVHDYGTIKYGADGECVFEFTNTGSVPLIISDAQGSCGCTVPSWPKKPIAPGETAQIVVNYKTTRVGAINKSVTITSNAVNSPTKIIRIKGNVLPKPCLLYTSPSPRDA